MNNISKESLNLKKKVSFIIWDMFYAFETKKFTLFQGLTTQ